MNLTQNHTIDTSVNQYSLASPIQGREHVYSPDTRHWNYDGHDTSPVHLQATTPVIENNSIESFGQHDLVLPQRWYDVNNLEHTSHETQQRDTFAGLYEQERIRHQDTRNELQNKIDILTAQLSQQKLVFQEQLDAVQQQLEFRDEQTTLQKDHEHQHLIEDEMRSTLQHLAESKIALAKREYEREKAKMVLMHEQELSQKIEEERQELSSLHSAHLSQTQMNLQHELEQQLAKQAHTYECKLEEAKLEFEHKTEEYAETVHKDVQILIAKVVDERDRALHALDLAANKYIRAKAQHIVSHDSNQQVQIVLRIRPSTEFINAIHETVFQSSADQSMEDLVTRWDQCEKRFRVLRLAEENHIKEISPSIIELISHGLTGKNVNITDTTEKYHVDASFGALEPQHMIFNTLRPLLLQSLMENDLVVLSYGPHKTGKTYSLFGPAEAFNSKFNWENAKPTCFGLVFRTLRSYWSSCKQNLSTTLRISITAVENDQTSDILDHVLQIQPQLELQPVDRQSAAGFREYRTTNLRQTCMALFNAVAFHAKYHRRDYGTFSHLVVKLTSQNTDGVEGSVTFVDLASADLARRQSDYGVIEGRQSKFVATSLTAITDVLHRNKENRSCAGSWRNSKLTSLIRAGCSIEPQILLLGHIVDEPDQLGETMQTINYCVKPYTDALS